ncbi:TetR/AcrR family transcriptional regulator [Virgibacillus sp. NKC19-16]|uniref:TetR/AcrR family transcriptional regulator n=1 Tax=Virgibacillus salidurans TaxID=2831673 RepID=UPI00272CB003|nr:TetR/AcrR family transcriptional regulator [Virgibacillus sp. NKC19-16]UJL46579.1 TetR/AcrR family transcriptional regulator [Virgibacillus sp. NKC19-16]
MGQRREEMLDAAVQLFQKNGFHSTSVEDITRACGISKGAFYNHFDSKESMILQVLQRYYDEMFREADYFSKGLHSSPIKVLKKKITIELERSIDYRYFFHAVMADFPPDDDGPIPKSLNRMQHQLHEWHKHALLEAFGPKPGKYLNDLAVVMEGTVHSYLMKIIWEGAPAFPLDRIGDLIAECLHAIVANDEHIFPVLPRHVKDAVPVSILENMKHDLDAIRAELGDKKDIQTIDLLIEELGQEKPREFLIDALLNQLYRRPNLKNQLTVILTTWEVWKDDEI